MLLARDPHRYHGKPPVGVGPNATASEQQHLSRPQTRMFRQPMKACARQQKNKNAGKGLKPEGAEDKVRSRQFAQCRHCTSRAANEARTNRRASIGAFLFHLLVQDRIRPFRFLSLRTRAGSDPSSSSCTFICAAATDADPRGNPVQQSMFIRSDGGTGGSCFRVSECLTPTS